MPTGCPRRVMARGIGREKHWSWRAYGPCRLVANCVHWFTVFTPMIPACDARCYAVPCGWFAFWFAILGVLPTTFCGLRGPGPIVSVAERAYAFDLIQPKARRCGQV